MYHYSIIVAKSGCLLPRCLLEVLRRHRVANVWSRTTEQYIRRLNEFQTEELRRRSVLATALCDHILGEIFAPLRQKQQQQQQQSQQPSQSQQPQGIYSATTPRVSTVIQHPQISSILSSTISSISSRQPLSRRNKCLSVNNLDISSNISSSSPYRLPGNRGGIGGGVGSRQRLLVMPPTANANRTRLSVDNSPFVLASSHLFEGTMLSSSMSSLPSVTEADLLCLATHLDEVPEAVEEAGEVGMTKLGSLARLIHESLEEQDSGLMATLTSPPAEPPHRRRRSRIISSPGALWTSGVSVGVNTTTEAPPLCRTAAIEPT